MISAACKNLFRPVAAILQWTIWSIDSRVWRHIGHAWGGIISCVTFEPYQVYSNLQFNIAHQLPPFLSEYSEQKPAMVAPGICNHPIF